MMKENFRDFLERLRASGEMLDIRQPVDIRHIATLVDQSDKALFFHDVIGYEVPVVSGIIRTRERSMMGMGCTEYGEIEHRLRHAIDNPIPPRYVEKARHQQVTTTGDMVDLFSLPIPMSSIYDGGPMITAGIVMQTARRAASSITCSSKQGVCATHLHQHRLGHGPCGVGLAAAYALAHTVLMAQNFLDKVKQPLGADFCVVDHPQHCAIE